MKRIINNRRVFDTVIIGGGASGLAAAAELGMTAPGLDVAVIEKNDEPGRKIRATGSGRCNITNTEAEGYTEILRFFTRIGIMTRAYDNGLVYPYSESAADVAALLTSRVRELGAELLTGHTAETVECREASAGNEERSFIIRCSGGSVIFARSVILALGGKAGPSYGTTGDGYAIARNLGHTIVTPVPVLTSIECREWSSDCKPCGTELAGTRTRGVVTLHKHGTVGSEDGAELFRETGEIQFTRFGLSGICVFNMTRHMRYDRAAGESPANFTVTADLFPDGDIEDFLRERRDNAFPSEKAGDVLRTVLKENIAAYVMETAAVHAGRRHLGEYPLKDLTDRDISAIGSAVHCLTFHPERIRGWKDAQATAGGVSTEEIDDRTCESKIVPGLYITGELADRDFRCGGFNLSNAWLTGIRAARAIASDN